MINEQTIDKLTKMGLYGMCKAFRNILETKKTLTTDETLAYLVDTEWDYKKNKKLERLLKSSNLRYKSSFQEIDFNEKRNLDKNQMVRLFDCSWIKKSENVLISGPTGVGKSYIACVLGHTACLNGYKTMYINAMKLFTSLKYSKADGSYIKLMENIKKQDVLIIDDFGLEIIEPSVSLNILEILEDRYNKKSTIIASQLPFEKWYEIISEKTIADAVCDRIFENVNKIELKGESMRRKKH
ncbi:MAG TPA: IS21-like element helper ATPase IstB [Spirochaetota bacterium]|nr:IS21-like element helper ATPase IstB [Spirochaetota bacterium]